MKRKLFKISLALFLFLSFTTVNAQLDLPRPSPTASITQSVGLTEITIDYSCPGVKGRKIWGDLVPYNEIWRAGANSATKITFSKDVSIEGTVVPKGSYSILMIPTETNWTIIINSDPTVSTNAYKLEKDVVRIITKPTSTLAGPVQERLSYSFSDFDDAGTTITMAWERLVVSFKVSVDTDKQANANIESATGKIWSTYNNAARYYFDKKDFDKALDYVNKSIAVSDKWFNNWVKAEILAAKGMKAEAYTFAAKAKELGDKEPENAFFFKNNVEQALKDWAEFAPKKGKKK